MEYAIGALIGYIIMLCIFGAISKHINESKGYYGGFAWGFWLGIIGIIVVACRPENRSSYIHMDDYAHMDYENEWKCYACGRINQNYVTTCLCGCDKNGKSTLPVPESKSGTGNVMSELKKYKEMLDAGLITDEDYENKKKELMK